MQSYALRPSSDTSTASGRSAQAARTCAAQASVPRPPPAGRGPPHRGSRGARDGQTGPGVCEGAHGRADSGAPSANGVRAGAWRRGYLPGSHGPSPSTTGAARGHSSRSARTHPHSRWLLPSVAVQQAVTSTALGRPWPLPPHAARATGPPLDRLLDLAEAEGPSRLPLRPAP